MNSEVKERRKIDISPSNLAYREKKPGPYKVRWEKYSFEATPKEYTLNALFLSLVNYYIYFLLLHNFSSFFECSSDLVYELPPLLQG